MKTKEKNTGLNGAVEKKLTPKQKKLIQYAKEAQETFTELYKKGQIEVYDPKR